MSGLRLSMRFAKFTQMSARLSRIGQQTRKAGLRDENRRTHLVIDRQHSLRACTIDLA